MFAMRANLTISLGESLGHALLEPCVIMTILIINAIVGVSQERSSEQVV